MSNDTPPATWRVDSQNPRQRVQATGVIEDGYDIAFTTGNGHPGQIFVPLTRYTPAQVKPLLQAAADAADAVGNLTHDSQV